MSQGQPAFADVLDGYPRPRVTVVNGGQTKMYFHVVIMLPVRVQVAFPGTITKVNSPRWSYRLHADLPSTLHNVAGLQIPLDAFYVSVGRDDWIATTSCPRDRLWRYRLRMTSTSGQALDSDGSVPCRS